LLVDLRKKKTYNLIITKLMCFISSIRVKRKDHLGKKKDHLGKKRKRYKYASMGLS
jgi:hypothetical protein